MSTGIFTAHTTYQWLVVSYLGADYLKELFTDIGREHRAVLLLDRWRLGDLDLTHVIVVDQCIVSERKAEGGA